MAQSCEDLRGGEEDANPFLFSNFLKKDQGSLDSAKVWSHFDSSNESLNYAPFPDKCENVGPKVKKNNLQKTKKKKERRILKIVDDEVQKVNEEEVNNLIGTCQARSKEVNSPSSSDSENGGNICNSDESSIDDAYVLSAGLVEDHQSRIQELESENEMLKKKLSDVKKDAAIERDVHLKRIAELVKEVQMAKKKELEETAALENVVHMVEENLKLTTQRALKAEAVVAKLKDDIKFLKEDTIPRAKYNQLVEDYQYTLESVRKKSKDTANLMRLASDKTEPLVKELLSGVSSLRILAEQFESIDKITEVDPTRDRVV